VSSPDLVQRG